MGGINDLLSGNCKKLFMMFQLSQLIVNAGGVAAVVDYVGESKSNVRLPGIMMLGYVAAHSENLAMAVIVSKVYSIKTHVYLQSLYHTYVKTLYM